MLKLEKSIDSNITELSYEDLKTNVIQKAQFNCVLVQSEICNPGDFLDQECTFVSKSHFIYEGEEQILKQEAPYTTIVAHGICPSLVGLNKQEFIEGCKNWFRVSI